MRCEGTAFFFAHVKCENVFDFCGSARPVRA